MLGAQITRTQDTVLNAIYRGKLYWFYGDTNRLSYALGNFSTSGATTPLPEKLDPSAGFELPGYFVSKDGFSQSRWRSRSRGEGDGVLSLSGVVVLPDAPGKERMFACFERRRGLGAVLENGFVVYNDANDQFERYKPVALNPPFSPQGVPFHVKDNGVSDYLYFTSPYPALRVKADKTSYLDLSSYEGFTCLAPGTRYRHAHDTALERDVAGKLIWAWKKDCSSSQ